MMRFVKFGSLVRTAVKPKPLSRGLEMQECIAVENAVFTECIHKLKFQLDLKK